jgi:hypothetical protein
LPIFIKYASGQQFSKDQEDRLNRVSYFQKELPRKLTELSEVDIEKLVTMLWASQMWGNKQYLVSKVISDNGIEKLQRELKHLFDNSSPVAVRYERFLREIKQLGPASLTEMLCYTDPEVCGVWNQRARKVLKILGLDSFVDPDKYRLSGDEYETFNKVLRSVAEELKAAKFQDVDLLLVDFFLFEVGEKAGEQPLKPEPVGTFDHDEIRDLIRNIGVMLGFDADIEVPIGYGARVDVVWRARIGNLGLVTYVFEVHKKGSIDSLLLNLQKAKSSPTVQKVIAVSDEAQLEEIKHECEGLQEEFRRSLAFWQAEQVQKVGENLQSAIEVIGRLGLVQEKF